MDRHVGAAVEHGLLDLLDEDPLPTDRVQRHRLIAVAGGLDRHEFGVDSGRRGDRGGDDLGLRERLRATASGEAESAGGRAGHESSSNRSLTAAALRSPCGVPAS